MASAVFVGMYTESARAFGRSLDDHVKIRERMRQIESAGVARRVHSGGADEGGSRANGPFASKGRDVRGLGSKGEPIPLFVRFSRNFGLQRQRPRRPIPCAGQRKRSR